MEFLNKIFHRNIVPDRSNLNPTITEIIDAADRARSTGLNDDRSANLGIMFGALRRKQEFTFGDLSTKTGVAKEKIIDLELGTLPLPEACTITEQLRDYIKVDEEEYKHFLISSAQKK